MPYIATETDRRIGEIVSERRKKAGLTQAQLGARIGVTFQQVQKYERGVNRIASSTLLDAANALGCHVADLFPDSEDSPLTGSERSILRAWKDLREHEREAVLAMIKAFKKG
ncbi:helix-turn-helix transcriptional regulator [uncultured Brevundimonas sp.]|uniref:helix-turn-helix domain-containing protein n=1 Tax=uncultured Brevundimonas sp. TaxID=213418 RepID=UPI0025D3031D|nr:helix-turn-helix transcriptional regulator [uncultured Brevundimonas sp.]